MSVCSCSIFKRRSRQSDRCRDGFSCDVLQTRLTPSMPCSACYPLSAHRLDLIMVILWVWKMGKWLSGLAEVKNHRCSMRGCVWLCLWGAVLHFLHPHNWSYFPLYFPSFFNLFSSFFSTSCISGFWFSSAFLSHSCLSFLPSLVYKCTYVSEHTQREIHLCLICRQAQKKQHCSFSRLNVRSSMFMLVADWVCSDQDSQIIIS